MFAFCICYEYVMFPRMRHGRKQRLSRILIVLHKAYPGPGESGHETPGNDRILTSRCNMDDHDQPSQTLSCPTIFRICCTISLAALIPVPTLMIFSGSLV